MRHGILFGGESWYCTRKCRRCLQFSVGDQGTHLRYWRDDASKPPLGRCSGARCCAGWRELGAWAFSQCCDGGSLLGPVEGHGHYDAPVVVMRTHRCRVVLMCDQRTAAIMGRIRMIRGVFESMVGVGDSGSTQTYVCRLPVVGTFVGVGVMQDGHHGWLREWKLSVQSRGRK